jgi:glycosyltransferase involved in cell wall biosynthesis
MRHNSPKPVFIVAFNGRLEDGCDYAIQTIRQLARVGRVYGLCLGEPISWRTILLFRRFSFIEKKHGASIFRPAFIIPGQRHHIIRTINYTLNAILLRVYIGIIHPSAVKYFWFFEPFNIPRLLDVFKGYITIYDCVDYFYDFSHESRSDEQRILFSATYIFANSHSLYDHLKQFRKDVYLAPLGFSIDTFRDFHQPRFVKTDKHQFIVGYVGGIDTRIDVVLLTNVIRKCPTIQFLFYGHIESTIRLSDNTLRNSFQQLFSLPNARYMGRVQKAKIPAIINTFNVGIIPYRMDSEFNTHCFPMKVMEYLYAQKPVVTTPIKELVRYQDVLRIKRTSTLWIRALHKEIRAKHSLQELRNMRRIPLAHTWEKKVSFILQAIGLINS